MIDYRDPAEEAAFLGRLRAQAAAEAAPGPRQAVDVDLCIVCLGAGEVMTPEGAAICGLCQGTGEE